MLISDFQNSIQSGYLIKNIEIGLFVFDIPNTVQSHYGLALSLEMTWPNPAQGHSLTMRSLRPLTQDTISVFSTEPRPYFPSFLSASIHLEPGLRSLPPPCSTVYGSFHFTSISSTCGIRYLFLHNDFFL